MLFIAITLFVHYRSAWITGCLYTVHKDPKIFPNPEKFDPERFIDENGKLINASLVIPFGIGEIRSQIS